MMIRFTWPSLVISISALLVASGCWESEAASPDGGTSDGDATIADGDSGNGDGSIAPPVAVRHGTLDGPSETLPVTCGGVARTIIGNVGLSRLLRVGDRVVAVDAVSSSHASYVLWNLEN